MSAVSLVWITPDAERVIIDCARVSNPANQGKEGSGLIEFLISHKHWSPFEMASACFEITTSKAVAVQMLRHRSFSFQEFSQRYAEAPGVEPVELRMQADKNRQSSTLTVKDGPSYATVESAMQHSLDAYQHLLNSGVARECARMVLPMATTTRLYMAGTVRSWIHYLEQRTSVHAQQEHQEIAQAINTILFEHIPTIMGAVYR